MPVVGEELGEFDPGEVDSEGGWWGCDCSDEGGGGEGERRGEGRGERRGTSAVRVDDGMKKREGREKREVRKRH